MTRGPVFAFLVTLHLLVEPAHAQNSRKMEFLLGERDNELAVIVEYDDPSTVDPRLSDALVLPMSFKVQNVSARPVALGYEDLRLNLGGNLLLAPVSSAAASREISRTRRVSALLGFLGPQSSAFQPYALEVRLEAKRLKTGTLQPGETKEGYVYFIRPVHSDPSTLNGVEWLEMPGRRPQMLETKGMDVWTRPPERIDIPTKVLSTLKGLLGTPPAFNKSYALLMGVEKYQHLPPLSSPAQDVERMAGYLKQQGFDEVVTIKDESVTPDTFQQPEKYLKIKLEQNDRFLFYYSGHGVSVSEGGRPRGYLPMANEAADGSHTRSIAMDDLVKWMKGLSAQHLLVILDACFSGLAIEGIELHEGSFRLTDPKVDQDALNRLSRGPAQFLLMAGTAGQQSFGGRRWNGSVFTDTLIKGMQNGADFFHNGIVTTRELYVYLHEVVPKEARAAGRDLTPLFMDLSPTGASQGEFVFVP